MAELWVRTLARQARIRLPHCAALRRVLTAAAVHTMAHWLLFPALLDSGVPARLLQQLWPAAALGSMCGNTAALAPQ